MLLLATYYVDTTVSLLTKGLTLNCSLMYGPTGEISVINFSLFLFYYVLQKTLNNLSVNCRDLRV